MWQRNRVSSFFLHIKRYDEVQNYSFDQGIEVQESLFLALCVVMNTGERLYPKHSKLV